MNSLLSLLARGPAGETDERWSRFALQDQSQYPNVYGYYDPPSGTSPGRLLARGSPSRVTRPVEPIPYFETTAAFDKLVADALLAESASDEPAQEEQQFELRSEDVLTDDLVLFADSHPNGPGLWRWTTIGLGALVIILLSVGGAVFATRRTD